MRGLVLAIRHGATAWNLVRRLQGHRDIPLCEAGRRAFRGARIPARFASFASVSSPLVRCLQTAELLGGANPRLEPRIIEMDWGEWEGASLADLRRRAPDEMEANEALGLDFRPRGGESPRDVLERLTPWLEEVGEHGERLVAFTHKGVIRTLLSKAIDWDMKTKASIKLRWERGHLFAVDRNGSVSLLEANVELGGAPTGSLLPVDWEQ